MSPPRKNLQTSIPTVGALCEKLGYGKAKNEVTGLSKNDLTETTQVWRKKYVASSGKPGRELKDWKSATERQELLVMATEYLDEGNGERFWPSSSTADSMGRHVVDDSGRHLRYLFDEDKIAKILRQLFWKQNYYDVHNAREERKRASRERSLSGLTSTDPIIIDSIEGVTARRVEKTPPPKYTERASQEQNISSNPFRETVGAPKVSPRSSKPDYRSIRKHRVGLFSNQSEREGHQGKRAEQETPNIYDDIEGGNEPALPRRLFPAPRISAESSGNNDPNSKPAKDHQGSGEPPNDGRATKRQKNTHRDDTTLRQSVRTPKRRVLPNLASPEEVAALLGENATPVRPNIRHAFVEDFEESPSPEPEHILNVPAKSPEKPLVQKPKEPSHNDGRDPSRPDPGASVPGTADESQAEAPEMPPTRTGTLQQRAGNPSPENPSPEVAQPTVPETSTTTTRAPATEGSAKAAAETKSRIDVDFWVIKGRKPRLEYERWREGMLRGKSLSFFIEGASRITGSRCIEELKCSLQTYERLIIETVHKNDEMGFEKMKSNFTNQIKQAWAKDRNGKENFEIWIEPIYGEDPSIDGEADMEDMELGDF
ncbi:hypothetical protein GP486_004625 [Trichoglossum hirsutum]|uniref:Uncharacterized protein n=1 Tax=Trichoglossum hirsutum TaxID=265104 RepID=A0A9P8LAR5_9PEZI|nr:hypothetical protein GP486_004625 [Trichoglossum hirsutum]